MKIYNSLFTSNGGEMLTRVSDGEMMGAPPAWKTLIDQKDNQLIQSVIDETREN